RRFPLLLKFLDVQKMLSVQVHPTDAKAASQPNGESGKTEAWVVLEADPGSRIYAGLKARVTATDLPALSSETVNGHLSSFTPKPGDAVFIEAGTVHSLGHGVLVFEVQENSDVTYRLYDWDHIDPRTGHKRPLQIEQALACIDFSQGPVNPVKPLEEASIPVQRERLFACSHFRLWRNSGVAAFPVGDLDEARVAVCIEGRGRLRDGEDAYRLERGDVMLIPASVGICQFEPEGRVVVLEIAGPEAA
ncbi:MAG: type I phosphomannose isomerase catalytic subunit, partial [Rhodomicrobium sp.]